MPESNENIADQLARGNQPAMLAGHKYEAISVGGFETCHMFPSLKLCFDIGRCPQKAIAANNLLLTHTHLDHVGGIFAYVASRGMLGLEPPTVVVPPGTSTKIRAAMDAVSALDGCQMEATLVELSPTSAEGVRLSNGLIVRAFFTSHPVVSQGYVVYRSKSKLKEEFRGLDQKDIAARARSGVKVNEAYEVPLVSFTGDTDVRFLQPIVGDISDIGDGDEDDVASHRHYRDDVDGETASPSDRHDTRAVQTLRDALMADAFLCECTFVDDSVKRADALAFGHMTYQDIVAHRECFTKCRHLVLTHFSARYRAQEVRDALQERLPTDVWERCIPLLRQFPESSKDNASSK